MAEQTPFSVVLPNVQRILADPQLPSTVRTRFVDELLQNSGWTKEDFKRNYEYVKARTEGGWMPRPLRTLQDAVVKGMTLNLDDEIRSGLSAAADVVSGREEKLPAAFQRKMDVEKAIRETQGAEDPATQFGGEIFGAIASPFGTIGQGGGLFSRLLAGAGAGAVAGAGAGDSVDERLSGAVTGAGFGLAGQTLGEGLSGVLQTLDDPTARAAREALERQNIPQTAGMTGGPTLRGAEVALANMPVSAEVVRKAHEGVEGGAALLAERVGQELSPNLPGGTTIHEAGGLFKSTAKSTKDAIDARIESALDQLVKDVGPDAPADLTALRKIQARFLAAKAKAPRTQAAAYDDALNFVNGMLNDAGAAGNLPYSIVRRARTTLGAIQAKSGPQQPALKQLYGALKDVLTDTALQASPEAARRAKAFDRFVTGYRQGDPIYPAPADVLDKIINAKTDEQAWNALLTQSPRALDQLRRLTTRHGRDAWDAVAASVWNNLGHAKPGIAHHSQEFSLATFLTNWNKLDPAKRSQFFRGTQFQRVQGDIDDLITILQRARDMNRLGNPSGTARNEAMMGTIAAGGAAAVAALLGNPMPGLALAGGLAGGYLSSRVLTSPTGLRVLRRIASAKPGADLARMFAQLRVTLNEDDQTGLDQFLMEHRL